TLKLIARSAFTIAKRTAFAMSQPMMRMKIASTSLGRKAPIWCSDSRIGSSSMLTFSITFSCRLRHKFAGRLTCRRWCLGGLDSATALGGFQQAGKRNARPVGAIVYLVLELINGFLEHQQLKQPVHFRARANKSTRARHL